MKVFISWSGPTSKQVAEKLRKWLPYMIQAAKPFISSDIGKGDEWNEVLTSELNGAEFGIICITPYNADRPWLIFETGAMAHVVGRPRVAPLLYKVPSDILAKGPLGQFQATKLEKDDFSRLVASINKELPADSQVAAEVLEQNFLTWWTMLEADLATIVPGADETRTYYNWLRTTEDLIVNEKLCACDTVWFVTSDIFNKAIQPIQARLDSPGDAPGGQVAYHYLFPDRDELRVYEPRLAALKSRAPKFDYRWVESSTFAQQAPADYVIIESIRQDSPKVYVRVPIKEDEPEYWFEAKPDAAEGFFMRFKRMWEEVPETAAAPPDVERVVQPTVMATLGARVSALGVRPGTEPKQ